MPVPEPAARLPVSGRGCGAPGQVAGLAGRKVARVTQLVRRPISSLGMASGDVGQRRGSQRASGGWLVAGSARLAAGGWNDLAGACPGKQQRTGRES
jgi:hypothetical protein